MVLTTMSNKLFRSLRYCGSFRQLSHVRIRPRTICLAAPFDLRRRQERLLSHHSPFPYPDIPTTEAAKNFVIHLDENGRSLLLEELKQFQEAADKASVLTESEIPPVTKSQVKSVIMYHGVPFIGFGILDNMIMIVAGEYIDITIGAFLGISTMAAAALGNLISDLAGVGSAGYVELLASKVGVHPPDLTPAQTLTKKIRWSVGLGRGIGITIGCLIGMFPLLFYDKEEEIKEKKAEKLKEQEQAKAAAAAAVTVRTSS